MNKFKEAKESIDGSNTPKFFVSPENSETNNQEEPGFIKFKKNFNLSFANSDPDSAMEEKNSQFQGVSTISNFQLLSPREQ